VYTAEVVRQLDETDEEALAFVIRSFRERMNSQAKSAIIPFDINEKIPGLELHVPQRGDKKKLVDLSLKNANHFLLEARKRAAFLDPERNTQRILETIKKDLPQGFQSAEFVLEHGFLDFITPRKELKETLSRLLHLFNN
jgi:excinuclease ABC subunit C